MKHHPGWKIISILLLLTLLVSIVLIAQASSATEGSIATENAPSDPVQENPAVSTSAITEPFVFGGHLETGILPSAEIPLESGNIRATGKGVIWSLRSYLHRSRDGGSMWQYWPGSPGGRVFAFSPTFYQDGIAAVGSDSYSDSLHLSSDGGRTWRSPQQVIDRLTLDIVFSPTFYLDQTIYAVFSDNPVGRLWRSTDGGEHWHMMNNPPRGSWISEVLPSPYFFLDQTLFVHLYDNTLWRSADGGSTWHRADNGLGTEIGNDVYDIDIAPIGGGENAFFAATKYALVVSLNNGQTWYLVDSRAFRQIAVPIDFAFTLEIFGISGSRLMLTKDLGLSWAIPFPDETIQEISLSLDYLHDRTLYAYNDYNLWRSENGGVTWTEASSKPQYDISSHILKITLSPDFANDGTIFASRTYGTLAADVFLKSTDGGRHWNVGHLPQAGGTTHLAVSPAFASDNTMYAFIEGTLCKSTDRGETWMVTGSITEAVHTYDNVLKVSPDYTNDHAVFIGTHGPDQQKGGIYRTVDDGQSWTPLWEDIALVIIDLEISPEYPDDPTIFASVYQEGVFRSDDGGVTWTELPRPRHCSRCPLALSPGFAQDDTLFVVYGGPAFRSQDRGNSWTPLPPIVGARTLTVSPRYTEDQTVLVATDLGELHFSEDTGETWSLIGQTPRNFASLAPDLVAAYENDLLVPFFSTKRAVYRYAWPDLSYRPPTLILDPGTTNPVTESFPIQAGDHLTAPWQVTESADWLAIAPPTGTLPATLTLTADPDMFTSTVNTALDITVSWSLYQRQTYNVPVRALYAHGRAFLPLVTRRYNPYMFIWDPYSYSAISIQQTASGTSHGSQAPRLKALLSQNGVFVPENLR